MWRDPLEDEIILESLICLVTEANVHLGVGFTIKKVNLFVFLEANIWSCATSCCHATTGK